MAAPATVLELVPMTIGAARAFVGEHHRHNRPPVSGLFAVGVRQDGVLVGVAIAGRPVARALDGGDTVELTRVCTTGTKNACSKLYGAACRAAAALGWKKAVTYTQDGEDGTSLRAAGFRAAGTVRARSWSCPSRPRGLPLFGEAADTVVGKTRWERSLS